MSESEYETVCIDEPVGETVDLTVGGEEVSGTITTATAKVASDEWPEIGETVTFKAVAGETEKEVIGVDKERDHPIQLDHGGWYERDTLVEYTRAEEHKIVELEDGRELWGQ